MEQIDATHILAACGAVPAILRQWGRDKDRNIYAKLSDASIGLVIAVAVCDWLTPPHQPMIALALGMVAATIGAPAIDAAHEITPRFVRIVVLGWAQDFVNRVGKQAPTEGHHPSVNEGDNDYE